MPNAMLTCKDSVATLELLSVRTGFPSMLYNQLLDPLITGDGERNVIICGVITIIANK